jgi:hypothetical protein
MSQACSDASEANISTTLFHDAFFPSSCHCFSCALQNYSEDSAMSGALLPRPKQNIIFLDPCSHSFCQKNRIDRIHVHFSATPSQKYMPPCYDCTIKVHSVFFIKNPVENTKCLSSAKKRQSVCHKPGQTESQNTRSYVWRILLVPLDVGMESTNVPDHGRGAEAGGWQYKDFREFWS